MKVLIVGPVAPFRSGIARHTTALAREISSRPNANVSIISFSRQYPKSLYPGESDRDPVGNPPIGIPTSFCLDAVNPFSWREAATKALRERPDVAIVPAWTFFVAPALAYVARVLRRQGIPVVTIVHNAEDHEAAYWKALLSGLQLGQSTRFVTHNVNLALALGRRFSAVPTIISPLPLCDEYPRPFGTLKRRASLELLFFGLIRPYKGLNILLNAIARAKTKDVFLSVVGEFWSGRAETESLIAKLAVSNRVELVPRYVTDIEAAEYFERCDAVVAPYCSSSASAVVALAQSYLRPVIASDIPGLAEAVQHEITGWLFPAFDIAALAELIDVVSQESSEAMHLRLDALRGERSWSTFANTVLKEI